MSSARIRQDGYRFYSGSGNFTTALSVSDVQKRIGDLISSHPGFLCVFLPRGKAETLLFDPSHVT